MSTDPELVRTTAHLFESPRPLAYITDYVEPLLALEF